MRPWLVLACWMTIGGVAHAQGTIQGDRVVVLRL